MPKEIVARILRLPGYEVTTWQADDELGRFTLWVRQPGGAPAYLCGGCGGTRRDVHSWRERRGGDLPGGTWQGGLGVDVHRMRGRPRAVRAGRGPRRAA